MRFQCLCALALLCPLMGYGQRSAALELLVVAMEGSYTSAEQAKADTNYFEIELEMKRIWGKRKDGAWLYVEQATADSKAKPYRQRVYHLQQVNDSTFTSDILTIRSGEAYFGAYADPVKLDALRSDSLDLLDGCTISLQRRGDVYVGSTNGRDCPNKRGGASYATSEVSLFSNRMVSWDRGYNDAGVQVWGAERGGYIFIKRPRY
ncbi:MAG: chromophore lyase CpcT/CpeT [Flavobacteriales bacterium]|nr:chromophore lyase CpcT/CpeT [Flavobacteriales bacterium]